QTCALPIYQKIRRRNNLGLKAREKLLLQGLVSLVFGVVLMLLAADGLYSTDLTFPFFKRIHPDFLISRFLAHPWSYPLAYLPFFLFVILVLVGSPNSVNLTDRLDGLPYGC